MEISTLDHSEPAQSERIWPPLKGERIFTLFESWLSPYDASLAYALCVVLLWSIPLWAMYTRRICIKL